MCVIYFFFLGLFIYFGCQVISCLHIESRLALQFTVVCGSIHEKGFQSACCHMWLELKLDETYKIFFEEY